MPPSRNNRIRKDLTGDSQHLDHGWFVYILRCSDGTLYTGITTDLERRLVEHNHPKSLTRYTRSRQPVELLYQESAPDRSQACIREAQIKKMPRPQKMRLIQTNLLAKNN
ncbi:MAG: GIY-YIG nuclease family protein [Acidiferrobacterales bacterium]|nr:GIY-YIG nuclease family protein [Acidiferrobacterales bacterium]